MTKLLCHTGFFQVFVNDVLMWDVIPIVSFCVNSRTRYRAFLNLCTWMPHRVRGAQPAGVSVRPRWLLRSPFEVSLEFKQPPLTAQNIYNSLSCKTLEAIFQFVPVFGFFSFRFFFVCFWFCSIPKHKNRSPMKNTQISLGENPAVNFS